MIDCDYHESLPDLKDIVVHVCHVVASEHRCQCSMVAVTKAVVPSKKLTCVEVSEIISAGNGTLFNATPRHP